MVRKEYGGEGIIDNVLLLWEVIFSFFNCLKEEVFFVIFRLCFNLSFEIESFGD